MWNWHHIGIECKMDTKAFLDSFAAYFGLKTQQPRSQGLRYDCS